MPYAFVRRSFFNLRLAVFLRLLIAATPIIFNFSSLTADAQTLAAANFGSPTSFGVGVEPFALTTGDFNRDGKADLVTANANDLSLLLGTGSGGFTAAPNFGAGTASQAVATGDFNGDGQLDLAAAKINSDNLSIMLGNGAGGFAAPISFRMNTEPFALATGDFNGDRRLDLATANFNSDSISILLGNGAGGFAAAVSFDVGDAPDCIKTADFNKDGRLDLATSNFNADNISILLGNGVGGFTAAVSFGVGDAPSDITIGDFNGDGKPDLATANVLSGNVSALLGNGAGGFAAAASFAVGDSPFALTAGDFNGDGKVDVAAPSGGTASAGNVAVLYGNGLGGFGAAVNFAAGLSPGSIVGADFNGDGRLDLAADINLNKISVLLNTAPVAAACNFSIDRTAQQSSAEGGDINVALTTASNCSWNTVSNSNWITVKTGNSGTGNGTVSLNVAANAGAKRTGTAAIGGQVFTVNQDGAPLNISGEIVYGNTSANQTTKFISGVDMNVSGGASFSRKSDNSGNYLLPGLVSGENYTVTPSKSADLGSITNFDASLVARHSAALISLTPNQLIAADVSGNGTVTSFDASLIARTATGTVNNGTAGQWKFFVPSKSYSNISASQTGQNFEAILMGDVSGNWTPSNVSSQQNKSAAERAEADILEEQAFVAEQKLLAANPPTDAPAEDNAQPSEASDSKPADKESASAAGIAVSLPVGASALKNATVLIPVTVENVTGQGVFGYDFTVSFDPAVLQPDTAAFDAAGTLSGAANFSVTPNAATAGQLIIGGSGTQPLAGSGTLLYLRFNVIGTAGSPTAATNLTFNQFVFNEGDPATRPTSGSFTVAAAAPSTAAYTKVSGRVMTERGRGIRNVRISMTDAQGNTRTTVSSIFGNYRFDNVSVGETYVFAAKAKRYQFNQPIEIKTINEVISNLNFIAQP